MREIPLSNGGAALVDDGDYERVSRFRWYRAATGYAVRSIRLSPGKGPGKTRQILLHRFLLDAPPGVFVDHADGNRLNNCRPNIRLCTYSQNCANRRQRRGVSSRFKGVSWSRSHRKWEAQIKKNGRAYYLGMFSDEREAGLAYLAAAKKLHGEFGSSNVGEVA